MGCISQFAKYILFIFNFLITLCGIILIVLGALYLINEQHGVAISSYSIGGFAIAIGVIIFIIAFFGCCGAIKENSCMLTTYALILIVLFVLQIVLATLIFVKISDDVDFDTEVYKLIEDLYGKTDDTSTSTVNALQIALKCCGIAGPSYWSPPYPTSCCENEANPCINPYTDGCAKKFADTVQDNIRIIGGIAIGFAVVEFVGAVFACMVRRQG